MRRWIAVVLLAALLLPGCSGVIMNAEYSRLLDQTVVIADEIAKRAEAGSFTSQEMIDALRWEAKEWHRFQDARDGVKK